MFPAQSDFLLELPDQHRPSSMGWVFHLLVNTIAYAQYHSFGLGRPVHIPTFSSLSDFSA